MSFSLSDSSPSLIHSTNTALFLSSQSCRNLNLFLSGFLTLPLLHPLPSNGYDLTTCDVINVQSDFNNPVTMAHPITTAQSSSLLLLFLSVIKARVEPHGLEGHSRSSQVPLQAAQAGFLRVNRVTSRNSTCTQAAPPLLDRLHAMSHLSYCNRPPPLQHPNCCPQNIGNESSTLVVLSTASTFHVTRFLRKVNSCP